MDHSNRKPGGDVVDILINNTGVGNYKSKPEMLEPEEVAGAVLLACKQSPGSRIIEIQMRTMAEALA